jgi:protein-tyrosine phosphatase
VPGIGVLFVCTGNLCRSPMAAALLRARLEERGDQRTVASAGLVSEGVPPPRQVIDAMWAVGLDLSDHRSRLVDVPMLHDADVVLAMTRQHLLDLNVMAPSTWGRMFTFAELIRRAEATGNRGDETLAEWVGRLHAGRIRADLLGLPVTEDIADPMGGRPKAYQRTRDELSALTDRLARLLAPA